MSGTGKTLFILGAAVTVICAVTALICGAVIALKGLTLGGTEEVFYAVGTRTENASEQVRYVRAQGGAGVLADGDFVIYAVYSERTDAEAVASEEFELLDIRIRITDEFSRAVSDAVTDTEQLWRALETGEASASYASYCLTGLAEDLAAYGAQGNVLAAAVMHDATEGEYTVAGNVRHASAFIAVTASAHEDESMAYDFQLLTKSCRLYYN